LAQRLAVNEITAWLALTLFLTASFAARGLVESRPDTLQLPLILAGLLSDVNYMNDRQASRARLAITAGWFGVALLFGNKAILVILASAWSIERYHDRILRWPTFARWRRLTLFVGLLLAPSILYWGSYLALGRGDLLRSLLTLSSAKPLAHASVALALLTHMKMIWLIGPFVFLLGALGLINWRRLTKTPGSLSPQAFLLIATCLVLLSQLFLMPVNLPHLSILPLLLLSIPAALWLRGRAGWIVIACLFLSFAAGIRFDPHQLDTRDTQLARFRYLLEVAPPDVPILDGYSGFACFRPIVGRWLNYRPVYFDLPESDEGTAEVINNLRVRGYAAVVIDPGYPMMLSGIRLLIERNYEPSRFPDIWLPRKTVAEPIALR
jgi:hypothetical protein